MDGLSLLTVLYGNGHCSDSACTSSSSSSSSAGGIGVKKCQEDSIAATATATSVGGGQGVKRAAAAAAVEDNKPMNALSCNPFFVEKSFMLCRSVLASA